MFSSTFVEEVLGLSAGEQSVVLAREQSKTACGADIDEEEEINRYMS